MRVGPALGAFILPFCVPQGGVLFYILYTADIIAVFEKHGFSVHFYVDDSQVHVHFVLKEVKAILNATELCIQDVLKWSSSRRLKLQGAKTEFTVIDRAGLLGSEADLTIEIDGVNIWAVSTVRDLSIILDAPFSMKSHFANVS
jgi:hypothetical protein